MRAAERERTGTTLLYEMFLLGGMFMVSLSNGVIIIPTTTDGALSWVLSYLLDRKQKVRAEFGESIWVTMKNGVPQGSILGPILFLVLVSDLYKSISNGKYHMYADDTQLYYHCRLNQIEATISRMNADLEKLQIFSKIFSVNHTKSNFIIILGYRPHISKLNEKHYLR